VRQPDSVRYTFTAHNVELPDGTQTLPGTELIAENGICRAVLRDLELAFPGADRSSIRIADLGCLEGGYTAAFAQAGYDVTGFEVRTDNSACCKFLAECLARPKLHFFQDDVRDIFRCALPDEWDAVFCCGLLYHLNSPVAFLDQMARATRQLLIVHTHYSAHPDAEHEGRRGHWYTEGKGRWESWGNERSFWLARHELMSVMRDVGFDMVFEQADYLADIRDYGAGGPEARSMFVGIKSRSAPSGE
jgi:SAM-dependent methyltransferase